jgi:hypothetical protein
MAELPPLLRPGQVPNARHWNALVSLLADAFKSYTTAPGAQGTAISVTGGGLRSFQVQDGRTPEHWAKIGAGIGSAYAHEQVVPNGAGGFEDLPASEFRIYGTATHLPAREISGRADVPVGAYVRLYPDPNDSAGFLFSYVPGSGGTADCVGCGWFAGLRLTSCLRVSVNETQTALYLQTEDVLTWTSADLLTICERDFVVMVTKNAGGVPQITLTESGGSGEPAEYEGQWNCCGCAFAKWAFPLTDICPDEEDTGDPCADVVEVRVDAEDCPPVETNCCPDDPIPANLCVTIEAIDPELACYNGTYPLTYRPAFGHWCSAVLTLCPGLSTEEGAQDTEVLFVRCYQFSPGVYRLSFFSARPLGAEATCDTVSEPSQRTGLLAVDLDFTCAPFEATGETTFDQEGAGEGKSVSVTIVPMPEGGCES